MTRVTLYSDGGCIKNPGPGGYGAVLIAAGRRRELSGGFRRTTNNRMEIKAVIAGLEALHRPCVVTVYSDSQYVVNAMSRGWVRRWRAHGWMRTAEEPARNADLWEQLLELCSKHQVSFNWIRGHAGNAENNRCDRLARAASKGGSLLCDEGFEAAVKLARRGRGRQHGAEQLHNVQKLSSAAKRKLPLEGLS